VIAEDLSQMASGSDNRSSRGGALLCTLAAAGGAATGIFAKVAYDAGLDVSTLLLLRFIVAAAVLWGIVAWRRPARPTRRVVLLAIGLGAGAYALQAATYFASLEHLDAGLASMLVYVYPTLVLVGAVLLRRERATVRRVAALGVASVGTVLVLMGGGSGGGAVAPIGIALVFATAIVYTAYVLVIERHSGDTDPFLMTAMVITSAGVSVGIWSGAHGGPDVSHIGASGWWAVLAIATVSTVVPTAAFLAGIRRLGPATGSIVATLEPVIAVVLAMVLFGDHLGPLQLLGGLGVIAAVVVVNLRIGPRPEIVSA
jgi:drug/metabolite transporter (DMT)-like permease